MMEILFPELLNIFKPDTRYKQFKIGSVHGLFAKIDKQYRILAILNDNPGNGHFGDTMEWFVHLCKKNKCDLLFLELMNEDFEKHLMTKYHFEKTPQGLIKHLK